MGCPSNHHCIMGDGPVPCRVMCVGEAPGNVEALQGKVLVGPTGQEYNQLYLPLAGLSRSEVYSTNTVKHTSTINRKPTDADVRQCANCKLWEELRMVQPEVVVLMGATACGLLPDIDLEVQHGIPEARELLGWTGWVVPMWHPALGLHKTGMMGDLIDDWTKLGEWLRDGEWRWSADDIPWLTGKQYSLIQTPSEFEEYTTATIRFSNPPWPLCGIDTESHGGAPYSVQLSTDVGVAGMILLDNIRVIEAFRRWFRLAVRDGMEVVFHNAPADLDVVSGIVGCEFPWRDTMQEAYHLGLPQSLKALSYRLLGRKRRSWEETVSGPSRDKIVEWISRAIVYAEDNWTSVEERVSAKTGKPLKPIVKASRTESILRSVLKHACESDGYDVWARLDERLGDFEGFDLDWLISAVGDVPVKGIKHVGLDEQVEYACSDADDTLAVAMELERMRGELVGRIGVGEEDRDR